MHGKTSPFELHVFHLNTLRKNTIKARMFTATRTTTSAVFRKQIKINEATNQVSLLIKEIGTQFYLFLMIIQLDNVL